MQIRSSGSTGNPQHFSDLDVCKPFYVVQHYYRTGTLWKLRQRLCQSCPQFRIFRGVPERRLKSIAELICRPHLSASGYVERGIGHNSIQPGSKPLICIEPLERLISANETFLYSVLRVLVNRHDGSGDQVRAPLVQTHQAREGGVIAGAGLFSQRAFLIWDTHRPGQALRGLVGGGRCCCGGRGGCRLL